MTQSHIVTKFNAAAPDYDNAAGLQATIAKRLVAWAAKEIHDPTSFLDIGCGTGFVCKELAYRWPKAEITALDASPAMLQEVTRKLPKVTTMTGDACTLESKKKFDVIFSSMALHWLPNPRHVLRHWKTWLKPNGKLFVALPTEGSFHEWRDLCAANDIPNGLWDFPPITVAEGMTSRISQQDMKTTHASPRDFLAWMKTTGASSPRTGHTPASISQMRKLLTSASSQKMTVTFQLAFLELPQRFDP